jgi:regulator-associated protein of mTOR
MTAVAVQPNGRGPQYNHRTAHSSSSNGHSSYHPPPQNHTASPARQVQRPGPPVQNGTPSMTNQKPPVSNTAGQRTNEDDVSSTSDQEGGSSALESSTGLSRDGPLHVRRLSLQPRPTSSPGPEYSSQDESERDRPKRRPKPLLQRSKSDFGPRGEDHTPQAEEDTQDWGARHGFDDHYASEEYVSQLANVSCTFSCGRLPDCAVQAVSSCVLTLNRIGTCTLQISVTRRPVIQN